MTEELKKYESAIKKKHCFAWIHTYEEETKTTLNLKTFAPIVLKAIEKLEWDIVYYDDAIVETKRKGKRDEWTEKITISYNAGKLNVKSSSLGNGFWDVGRNSKRVKLFIYAFNKTVKEYDAEALAELEKTHEATNNWDSYEVPEDLPPPIKRGAPKIWIPILGGILLAITTGAVLAYLTTAFGHVFILFESLSGLLIGFAFYYFIKWSNYFNFQKLHYILIGVVVLTFLSNQYFSYKLIIAEHQLPINFLEFIKLRFKEGLRLESFNTGRIGLVIAWVFQLGVTYAIAHLRFIYNFTDLQLEKVPPEVIEFAFYHHVKEKNEEELRAELSKMGWTKTEDQDDVFAAMASAMDANEFDRMD